jgi:hypothetical protein
MSDDTEKDYKELLHVAAVIFPHLLHPDPAADNGHAARRSIGYARTLIEATKDAVKPATPGEGNP